MFEMYFTAVGNFDFHSEILVLKEYKNSALFFLYQISFEAITGSETIQTLRPCVKIPGC